MNVWAGNWVLLIIVCIIAGEVIVLNLLLIAVLTQHYVQHRYRGYRE